MGIVWAEPETEGILEGKQRAHNWHFLILMGLENWKFLTKFSTAKSVTVKSQTISEKFPQIFPPQVVLQHYGRIKVISPPACINLPFTCLFDDFFGEGHQG